MKYYAIHTSRSQLKIALQELLKVALDSGISNDVIPKSVKSALDYAEVVDDKLSTNKADWRKEFFNFFNSDDFSEQATVEECEALFLTSLKGGSDITYHLLERLGAEYEIDINDVIDKGRA
jgi:hypothetical protein